ncbi:K02A2.6-like [Cordylochernes scorpioides]|uniref:RNA-directed DNA polymerase n=1 Tax=Cordylochernes scorpioides TaxID=51811 RepID=A0ABY6LGJ9_9ARAC|nr:K02A2.6-like [Cordylochernes scorpioides]
MTPNRRYFSTLNDENVGQVTTIDGTSHSNIGREQRREEGSISSGLLRPDFQNQENVQIPLLKPTKFPLNLWHQRLMHINYDTIVDMMKREVVIGLNCQAGKSDKCSDCMIGKSTKRPFLNLRSTKETQTLALVHCDLMGPFNIESWGGSRFVLTIIDDASRYTRVYFLKRKGDTLEKFKEWMKEAENQTGFSLKRIRTDNGLEFCSSPWDIFTKAHGIVHERTMVYTPEQNGVAERMNRTLLNLVRSTVNSCNLPTASWPELTNTAAYLRNRVTNRHNEEKTPFELWFGKRPALQHLRAIGCETFVHVPKQRRNSKLQPRATKGILVGYSLQGRGWRIWIPEKRQVVESRNCVFKEEILYKQPKGERDTLPSVHFSSKEASFQEESNADQPVDRETEELIGTTGGIDQLSETLPENLRSHPMTLRSHGKTAESPEEDNSGGQINATSAEDNNPTYEEAMNSPEVANWIEAIEEERESLERHDVWQLQELPKGIKPLKCRWVLNKKINAVDGTTRYKSRLVAKGFTQRRGIDYNEVYTPVSSFETIRLLTAIATEKDWFIDQFDVKSAYLHGTLNETIYMEQPECFKKPGEENLFCKLKKSIYGLKQSGRCWNKFLNKQLHEIGFQRNPIDPSIYEVELEEGRIILSIYVDDIFAISENQAARNKCRELLNSSFEVKYLGPISHMLGVSFKKSEDGSMTLSQSNYIEELLQRFRLQDAKGVSTPMETNLDLSVRKNGNSNERFPYRELIGGLSYLSQRTRPDIAYAVGILSRYCDDYTRKHWEAGKRVLRYLKSTKDFGITYRSTGKPLIAFSDASWASDIVDRKGVSGHLIILAGAPIIWRSTKQTVTALSTMESEYIALSSAVKDITWVRNLMEQLKMSSLICGETKVFCDNQAAISHAENYIDKSKTRHFAVKYHFVREKISEEAIELFYTPSAENPADFLTKPLARSQHEKYCRALMDYRNKRPAEVIPGGDMLDTCAATQTPGNETVTRRSRRLQGLQPELSTVLAFPARKKMEREENRPFCHRWRDPTVFSGERGEDSQRWLSDFQRVARYNKWDDSMCLANVIFYLTGTAKCWFENFEEILNSWEEFKIKFCEIFGNKEDTARKAENILRTRAQTSGENVESYIQEVLLLCKQSNPRMSEGEKVSHLIKGVAEEVYQALIGKDIGTVDQFVAFCRRFEAFKRMRVAPPRFSRLPNVTTISTAEPENLEALIRRIVREEVQKFMAPPSTFAAQDIDTPPPDLRDVIRSEIQQTLAPISAPRQPESFRPRRQYLPQNDQVYRRRTEGPPNNQRTQWRTEDDRPICFHAATMEKNWISVNIQGRNVQALVDSGADYSVISEAFRRSIKAPVFKENGPLLRAADKKPIVTLVAAECSHDVILGWDFFKATDAIIDCGENKLYLSEAEKSYEWKDLKLCAAMDCVIPPKSFGKIVVTNQDVFGSRDVVVTGSKRLQLEKGLFIPSSLVRFLHGRAVLWVTNSTHQSQVIPSDMKIGTMQDLEVGSISNLEACSEIAVKGEVTSPDVRECLISMIYTDLEETKKNRLLTCLNEFSDIFDFEKKSFPVSGEIKHKIDTSDYPPVRQRPYRVSPAERRVIQSEVEKMMETKIIRPSSSPWASPVILVRKKDGSLRFCVDYRRLNKITKKDVYPLPRIDDALDTLSGSRYFSTMDMRSGYWQIEVDDKDREKTAFITPDGLYEFNVMPFGLCNAPATFERMIDNVLRGLKWDMCLCYLDDIVVYGSTFKEHLTRLYKVLRCIKQAGLCLNYKKCHFASRQITILGHVVNEFGTQPDPEKVKAIVHFPKPRNISETRSFLGLSSYYRRFIKSYANKSRPLNSLLKKDEKFIWGEEQDESFRILKQELGSSPVLGHFIEGAETHVHTDASGYGLGAVLVQIQNDAERPIAYASRTLTKAEKNYSTTEKECLAVVWALGKFRPYLYGRPFTVVTDHHSLCWLVGLKDPSGRLARWALKLQEYDINIVYKSGRKHKDADCLSRSPLADTAEIEGHITSIQDIAEEQSKDAHLVGIREKLANENLKGYQMIEGVLYKKNYDPEGKPWLLVVPKQMRHEILKDVHDTPMAGHLGFAKTYDRVRKRFYWPGLYRTVSQYIAHCKECQRRKGVPQKPPGLLVPIPPTTSPFQKIGIDYLGRFPISHTGNRWIIVATDYLTRFAITKAAATAEATELATFLIEDVILKHGAPREIITDRGRNFMSQTIREINNLNGTIHRFTTAYHPQTNGLTERLNKTLTDMISMYVDVDQKNWDNILPYVTFAYNTARQETTGYSPFFLVHGREVETPLDSILPYQPAGTAEDYAQSKDKERYDKKHQEVTYKEGDLVWVFTPIRTVGLSEKLLKIYFGPYRVIRKISSVNYQVEGVTNTRRRRKTQDIVHVVRMKPYHDPEVQEQIAQGHVTG